MDAREELPTPAKVALWATSVGLLGVVAVVILAATYREFGDCSNPELRESANTWFGWSVAVASSVVPVGAAARMTGWHHWLPVLAGAVAVFELGAWFWLLEPVCAST